MKRATESEFHLTCYKAGLSGVMIDGIAKTVRGHWSLGLKILASKTPGELRELVESHSRPLQLDQALDK